MTLEFSKHGPLVGESPGLSLSEPTSSSPRLRVVHLITGLTLGGAERHVESLLHFSRHDSQVLAVYRDGPVGQRLRAEGHRAGSLDLEGLARPTAILRLAGKLRRIRPDVVHVHLLSAQGVGIPAARLAGVPVIVSSEHSIMDNEVEGRPTTWRLKLLYRCWERLATHTVAVSPTTARRLRNWGVPGHRITVIDNGIDFEPLKFDPTARAEIRAELGIHAQAQVVGAVGRLDPVKRFPALVRGLSGWLAGADRHLIIAGTGRQRAVLETIALHAGVADRLHLVGARPDVIRLLSAFDVLASPSRDETFGIAVVEAVGNGLPVVYAACPALDDLQLRSPRLIRLPQRTGCPATGDQPRGGPEDTAGEEAALLDSVQKALAITAPGRSGALRREVPASVVAHYDIRRRAADVDELYLRLLDDRVPRRYGGEPVPC